MTARKDALAARMTGAAIKRTSTEPRQRGTNAVRTRPVRVTLDLDPTTYTALNRWIASAAVAVDPDFPRLSLARALRAMVHATIENTAVTDVVLDRLRQEDAPGRGVMP